MRARRTCLATSFGALLSLQFTRALEGSIARLHAPLEDGASYRDLAGHAVAAWKTWADGAEALDAFPHATPSFVITAHVVSDTLFLVLGLVALASALSMPATANLRNRMGGLWDRTWGKFAFVVVG